MLTHCSQVLKSAELVGFFVNPEVYCRLVLPALLSASSPGVLMTFAAIIRGTPKETLQPYLEEICNTLANPDVCHAEQVCDRQCLVWDTGFCIL